jgi:hypothetical protein
LSSKEMVWEQFVQLHFISLIIAALSNCVGTLVTSYGRSGQSKWKISPMSEWVAAIDEALPGRKSWRGNEWGGQRKDAKKIEMIWAGFTGRQGV